MALQILNPGDWATVTFTVFNVGDDDLVDVGLRLVLGNKPSFIWRQRIVGGWMTLPSTVIKAGAMRIMTSRLQVPRLYSGPWDPVMGEVTLRGSGRITRKSVSVTARETLPDFQLQPLVVTRTTITNTDWRA